MKISSTIKSFDHLLFTVRAFRRFSLSGQRLKQITFKQ